MTEKIQNKILHKANNKQIALGIRVSNSSEEVIEIAGRMGLDFVYLDAQHSPFTLPDIEKYCRLSQSFDLTTMIRLPDGERTTILNYLDRGANVIQIPDLQTAEEAKKYIKYTYFGPLGIRSATSLRTAMQIPEPANRKNLYDFVNKNTLILPQLESITAFNNLDSILKVEGINFFSGGPEDIAQSMGIPGQPEHPKVLEFEQQIAQSVRAAGKKSFKDAYVLARSTDLFLDSARAFMRENSAS